MEAMAKAANQAAATHGPAGRARAGTAEATHATAPGETKASSGGARSTTRAARGSRGADREQGEAAHPAGRRGSRRETPSATGPAASREEGASEEGGEGEGEAGSGETERGTPGGRPEGGKGRRQSSRARASDQPTAPQNPSLWQAGCPGKVDEPLKGLLLSDEEEKEAKVRGVLLWMQAKLIFLPLVRFFFSSKKHITRAVQGSRQKQSRERESLHNTFHKPLIGAHASEHSNMRSSNTQHPIQLHTTFLKQLTRAYAAGLSLHT